MAIRIKKDGTQQKGLVDDDVIQPFSIEKTNIRGRMVRLGPVLADIMGKHAYPPPVSALLSEVVTLSLLLATTLKYDGIFTLQIRGDGPVRTLVSDVTNRGHVRAYAGFDEVAVKKLARRKKDLLHNYYHLLGEGGHMAFTVDQGDSSERYQGLVSLSGESVVDSVLHYFQQSEQIRTGFRLAIHPQDGQWRAGAIMIQHMPGHEKGDKDREREDEDWNRASILLKSCTEGELVTPNLHSTDLLFRLFHEDGIRVYPATPVRHVCRCSREKVVNILRTLSRQELNETCEQEGHISVVCEFCSREYAFNDRELEEVFKET